MSQNQRICSECESIIGLTGLDYFNCSYCSLMYCTTHRLPEYHQCINTEKWQDKPPPGWKTSYFHKTPSEEIETKTKYIPYKKIIAASLIGLLIIYTFITVIY